MSTDQLIERMRQRVNSPELRIDMSDVVAPPLFPPAMSAALDTAEAKLSFPLYPLLRQLYGRVGNGGFGPGYGLLGIDGGYLDDHGRSIVGLYFTFASGSTSEGTAWPSKMLPICEWGDGIWSCIDCASGEGTIVTLSEKGLTRTTRNFLSWLTAWVDGVRLWDEMFEFKVVSFRNPFTGAMESRAVPARAKGIPQK